MAPRKFGGEFGGRANGDGMGGFQHRQSACPTPTGLDVRLTMKPTLFGNMFAWLFMGWLSVQAYTYYMNCSRDTLKFRAFVTTVLVFTLAESGLEAGAGYQYLVSNWGNNCILEAPPKAILIQPLLIAVMGTMVQSFYAWRIWVFGDSIALIGMPGVQYILKFFCCCIAVLTLLSVASAIAIPSIFLPIGQSAQLVPITRTVVIIWTVSAAAADTIITACMLGVFRHVASGTYFAETRGILSRLCRLTFQSGLLTTILAIGIVIAFLTEKEGAMHTLTAYLLGKSYPMSLLASLNARRKVPSTNPSPSTSNPNRSTPQADLSRLVFSPVNIRGNNTGRTPVRDSEYEFSTLDGPYRPEAKGAVLEMGGYMNRSLEQGQGHQSAASERSSEETHSNHQPRKCGSRGEIPSEFVELQGVSERDKVRCLSDSAV